MASALSHVESVTIDPLGQGTTRFPGWPLLVNIPLLHQMLEMVLTDWRSAVEPAQAQLSELPSDEARLLSATRALSNLHVPFLKSLFSYVMLFAAAQNAYAALYAQLDVANHRFDFHVKHPRKPKQSSYILKVQKIRNASITHMPSTRHPEVDALAAMMWQPFSWSHTKDSDCDLNAIRFGGFRFRLVDPISGVQEEASDFEIVGLPELHQNCMAYLESFDSVCVEYINALRVAATGRRD